MVALRSFGLPRMRYDLRHGPRINSKRKEKKLQNIYDARLIRGLTALTQSIATMALLRHYSFLVGKFERGGPDNPGVVVDDTLRCAHPMCLKGNVVAASFLRCDPGHRRVECVGKIAWAHKFL